MSSEAEQNHRNFNEEVDSIFNYTDYKRFEWAFLKYICEVDRPVTDYELFLTSNLGGYMGDENQMKEYVLKNKENVYKVATPYLQEKCKVFKKYMMGDIDTDLDLPVDIVRMFRYLKKKVSAINSLFFSKVVT